MASSFIGKIRFSLNFNMPMEVPVKLKELNDIQDDYYLLLIFIGL